MARLTQLNADTDDAGPVGPRAVEVYLPLVAGSPAHRVGVLEVYLPYAPIDADVSAGLTACIATSRSGSAPSTSRCSRSRSPSRGGCAAS